MHFRYATTGSKKESNCHPFLDEKTGLAFAHNGVLPFNPAGDITDSEYAFREFVLPAYLDADCEIGDEAFGEVVDEVCGVSRFALMDAEGRVRLFGSWIKGADGCWYSNMNFTRHLLQRDDKFVYLRPNAALALS